MCRLRPLKPGFTRTRMTEGMNREGFLWADADEVGKGIVHAMRQGKDEVYLKPIWRIIMGVIKAIQKPFLSDCLYDFE